MDQASDPWLIMALTLCRALHDGAAMLLFGTSLFASVLLPPSLRAVAFRRVHRIASLAIPIVVATGVLRLPLASVGMGDGWRDGLRPSVVWEVTIDTGFGRGWSIHLAAVACLAPFWFMGPYRSRTGLALASALVLATLSLSGHAAASAGAEGRVSEIALALHLLAAGAWVGGLVEVLALLPLLGVAEARHDATLALQRFSFAGHGFVAVAIVAGLVTVLAVVGSPVSEALSLYVIVLCVKIALVAGMALLASINRYRLVPLLRQQPSRMRRNLLRNTRTAILLGTGVVAAAGLLGLLDPP